MKLARRYGASKTSARVMFNNIATRYNEKHRHYHNLSHLDAVFFQFDQVRHLLFEQDAVAFALFFHDVIYDPESQTNELDSAVFAEEILKHLPKMDDHGVTLIKNMILATESHNEYYNHDVKYMLDIDLSVLGSDEDTYRAYAKNIRKEYAHIKNDGEFYTARRDRFLIPFSKRQIFKTASFQNKFEDQAHKNIKRELTQIRMKLGK